MGIRPRPTELIMRLNRRQPDLFEEPPRLRPIPNERRRAMLENLRALLTWRRAFAGSLVFQIREGGTP